jgi:hypothetical protein
MSTQGFLAIWCEIGQDDLVDYRNWLTQEHISDRIYSPGFLGVRLFASVENERSHFFLYATESPDVMKAPPYLQILNSPSPWTKRMMVKFGPFDRAAGERLVKIGRGFGSHVLVSRVRANGVEVDPAAARAALQSFIRLPDTVAVRLLKTDRGTTGIKSAEKQMRRGEEGDFDYLLVVEALCEAGAMSARDSLAAILPAAIPGAQAHDSAVCKMIYGEAPYEGEAA